MSESDRDIKNYNSLINTVSKILDKLRMDEKSDIYNLIYNNNSNIKGLVLFDPATMDLKYGNNYLCIYNRNFDIFGGLFGVLHYFTVIRDISNNYYLNSSYSSNYVCVNQYTTPLAMSEFIEFIQTLNNPSGNDSVIEQFFTKYFLQGNISIPDDYEGDRTKRFAMIDPDEGVAREIKVITQNKYRKDITCGLITFYDNDINEVVKKVIGKI